MKEEGEGADMGRLEVFTLSLFTPSSSTPPTRQSRVSHFYLLPSIVYPLPQLPRRLSIALSVLIIPHSSFPRPTPHSSLTSTLVHTVLRPSNDTPMKPRIFKVPSLLSFILHL